MMTMSPAEGSATRACGPRQGSLRRRAIENAGRPVGRGRQMVVVAMGNGRHHPFAARWAITMFVRAQVSSRKTSRSAIPRLLVAPSGSRRRDVRALARRRGLSFFATQPLSQKKVATSSASPRSPRRPARRKARNGDRNSCDAIVLTSSHRICRRQRCISFTTKLMLTSNCFAAALREVQQLDRSRRSSGSMAGLLYPA